MVSINYAVREVCCKIVYYGPGLSGKTTNLQYVHTKVPSNSRGNLISLATEADRTLYFDFLPINIGSINGFAAKFQLYTVPGQVYYNATRKLVLRGVDGIVFVADSQADKMDENLESLVNLQENLVEYGYDLNDLPIVIQYNKRDLPGVLPVSELSARLNAKGWPYFEASATIGNGVFDTLKLIIKMVLDKAKNAGQGSKQKPVAPSENLVGAASRGPVDSAPPKAPQPELVAASAAVSVGHSPGENALSTSPKTVSIPDASELSVNRPFPGDRTGGLVRPAATTADQPAPSELASPGPTPTSTTSTPKPDPSVNMIPPVSVRSSLQSPGMAPSIRKRPKKRGFFKRLFGIK